MSLTILLDADAVAWSVGFHPDRADVRAVGWVRNISDELGGDRVIACFSDPTRRYWRRDIWPAYKSSPHEPPPAHQVAKEALCKAFTFRELPGLEADDVIGVLATYDGMAGETIVAASDKDLRGIPGAHYDLRHNREFRVSEREADHFHLFQTLTGKSPAYPGCPKVGPKKAAELLSFPVESDWHHEAWVRVVLAFKARGLTERDALIQAQVARICRSSGFDFINRKVIPWTPKRQEVAIG